MLSLVNIYIYVYPNGKYDILSQLGLPKSSRSLIPDGIPNYERVLPFVSKISLLILHCPLYELAGAEK